MENSNQSAYNFATDNLNDMEKDFQIDSNILSHNKFGGWVCFFFLIKLPLRNYLHLTKLTHSTV